MSGSRFTINANFNSVKAEIESIESVFGLSLTSGNINVSGATGGEIKGKVGAFNSMVFPVTGAATITLNGATGTINADVLSIDASITVPQLTVNTSITNNGTYAQTGAATFNGTVAVNTGLIYGKVDLGSVPTHVVENSDRVLIFEPSGPTLTLSADPGILDGHVITLVKKGSGACALDVADIQGLASVSFSNDAYKSAITLMWNAPTNKWIVIGSSNMTLA
jgi:hypothetical protein